MSVTISGVEDLQKNILKFKLKADEVLDDMVRITALEVLTHATKSMQKVSQGRKVPRGEKYHTVSKEGDAPNVDTGRLVDSIDMIHRKGSLTAEVGTGVDYGAELELTRNRPWLVPAKDKALDNWQNNTAKALNKAIKKAGK